MAFFTVREISDFLEQPTEALLGMRRKCEDDQEFSRVEGSVFGAVRGKRLRAAWFFI